MVHQHFHYAVARIESRCLIKQKCRVALSIRSILRCKKWTHAEALVQIFPRKIERNNRATRPVLLQNTGRPYGWQSGSEIMANDMGKTNCGPFYY